MLRGGWHPIQIQALSLLSERIASSKEIAVELGMTKAKAGYVSYHVKKLHKLGLVELVRSVPVRGVKEHFYRAVAPFVVLDAAAERMTLDERLAFSAWTISLINRDFLRAIESRTIDERIDRHLTRCPLYLDELAIEELFKTHNDAFFRTQEIQDESRERLTTRSEVGRPVSSVIASFLMPEGRGRKMPASVPIGSRDSRHPLEIENVISSTTRVLRNGWHPAQIRALIILSEREASPKEIAKTLDLDVKVVSYHVKELFLRGQIDLVRTVPVRGANQHFYRAAAPLIVMGEDAERMSLEDRLILSCWTVGLINSDFWVAVESKAIDERVDRHLTRFPLLLDPQGMSELFALHNDVFFRTRHIQANSDSRRGSPDWIGRSVSAILASVPMPPR